MDGAQHELKRSAFVRQRRHDGVLPLRAAGSDWVAEPEVWAGGLVRFSNERYVYPFAHICISA